VINRNKGQIIYCYEQGLQGTPSLTGRVSVAFVIGASGRITTAKVAQTSLRSAQVESCMLAKMKNWQAAARNWLLNSSRFNGNKPSNLPNPKQLHTKSDKGYNEPL
jgi:hypothetical protein